MMKFIYLFILTCSFFISCKGDSDRNHLVFKDSVIAVQDSIIVMSQLMEKLKADKVINYFFDYDSNLFVNNQKFFQVKEIININSLDTSPVFSKFSFSEIERFVNVALFLRTNYVSGVHKDLFYGLYFYDYKEIVGGVYNDLRNIVCIDYSIKKLPISDVEQIKLLDQKGNLYLVSFVENKK